MTNSATLSERTKKARAAAGLSQPEAAVKAGIGLTALRNIEQGITDDPRISTIRSLERALGVWLYVHGAEGGTPDDVCALHEPAMSGTAE